MKLIVKKGEEIINKHSFTNRDEDYDFSDKFSNPFNDIIPRVGDSIQYITANKDTMCYTVLNIIHVTEEDYNHSYKYTCIVEVE